MTTPHETVSEARPLSSEESRQLNELMARQSAWTGPAARVGEPWVALINLSVPRRGDPSRQTDLVYAGEVLHLTDEEAATFNRHGRSDGRQVEVVQKLHGPESTGEVPRVPPRAVSGRLNAPPPPPPGSSGPRPDPEGSSAVQYISEDPRIPEATEPALGSENDASHLSDAVDLPPRSRSQVRRMAGS